MYDIVFVFYMMIYKEFHTKCINMYMCLNGVEHMHIVTVGCT